MPDGTPLFRPPGGGEVGRVEAHHLSSARHFVSPQRDADNINMCFDGYDTRLPSQSIASNMTAMHHPLASRQRTFSPVMSMTLFLKAPSLHATLTPPTPKPSLRCAYKIHNFHGTPRAQAGPPNRSRYDAIVRSKDPNSGGGGCDGGLGAGLAAAALPFDVGAFL